MSLAGLLHKGFGPADGIVPEAPLLSVVDNADGTGGVATISGSTAGTTNTVATQTVDGELGSDAWIVRGSRSNDGTVAISVSAGFYWVRCISEADGRTAITNLVYFHATTGAGAILYQCLAAVKARVQALALDGIANTSVVVRKLPLDRKLGENLGDVALPAVLITPQRETMNPLAGVNRLDDVGYGVMVTIIDRDNQEPTLAAKLPNYTLWRQQIARAFRNQRLPGVPEIINASVEPDDMINVEAWKNNLAVTALLLRFTSREPRGLGV